MMKINVILAMIGSLIFTQPAFTQNHLHQHLHQNSPVFDVPDLTGGTGFLDAQQERLIGEKVYRQVQKQMPVIQDAWLEDQLMLVFSQLLAQSQLGEPIALMLINDPQINAFAVPGGVFALNSGLILSAKNMGEVAGVMAHEIAHVSQRHYSRSKEAFKGQGLLALAGILVGVAAASQGNAEAGTAVMMGSQAMLLDKQLSYSRDQEREADRIGMQYLYTAGYDPHHMANFFETMQRASPQIGYLPDFWLTHPLTSERMSESRLRANQYPKRQSRLQENTDFELIQYYSSVLSRKTAEMQLVPLAKQHNQPAMLALSAYYLRKNEWQKAETLLKQVEQEYQHHVLFQLLKADLLIAQKKYQLALDFIQPKVNIMPENRALTYKLAEILILHNKGQQAQFLLLPFSQRYPRDVQVWRLLQQANHQANPSDFSTIQVLRYRAEQEYWSGQEEQGIKSLLHAQRLAKEKQNQSLMLRIESRLKQMQDEHRTKI